MTVQEIHEYIWTAVVDARCSGDIAKVKKDAIVRLYIENKISKDAAELLLVENGCVFCAMYTGCRTCPIGECDMPCTMPDSWYQRVLHLRDVKSAKKIRIMKVLDGPYDPDRAEILER